MLACVLVHHFLVLVALRRYPSLKPEGVVVIDETARPARVAACGPAAVAAGVSMGMSRQWAQALYPEAVFLSHDPEAVQDTYAGLLSVLEGFSPTIEATEPGTVMVKLVPEKGSGTMRREACAMVDAVAHRTAFQPCVGVAASRFVALVAARRVGAGHVLVVGPGQEAEFLAPLEVGHLPVGQETLRRLDLLGLRTLGQVAAIPKNDLIHQFGKEGQVMADLVRGIDPTPLAPRREPEPLAASVDFDSPVERLDVLLAELERMLGRLFARLRDRGKLCSRVVVALRPEGLDPLTINVGVAEPTRDPTVVVPLVRNKLSSLALTRPLSEVRVSLDGLVAEQGRQGSLFSQGQGRGNLHNAVKQLEQAGIRTPLARVVWDDPDSRIPERRAHLEDAEV